MKLRGVPRLFNICSTYTFHISHFTIQILKSPFEKEILFWAEWRTPFKFKRRWKINALYMHIPLSSYNLLKRTLCSIFVTSIHFPRFQIPPQAGFWKRNFVQCIAQELNRYLKNEKTLQLLEFTTQEEQCQIPISFLSRSPTEIVTKPYLSCSFWDWVPFPEPGGPKIYTNQKTICGDQNVKNYCTA